jgi:hypothetical protein
VCAGLALAMVFVMMTSKDSSSAAITTATMQSAGLHADRHSSSVLQPHQQRALAVDHDGTVHTSTVQIVLDSIVQDLQIKLSPHDLDKSDVTNTDIDTATEVVNDKPLAAVTHGNNGRVKVSSQRIATPSL